MASERKHRVGDAPISADNRPMCSDNRFSHTNLHAQTKANFSEVLLSAATRSDAVSRRQLYLAVHPQLVNLSRQRVAAPAQPFARLDATTFGLRECRANHGRFKLSGKAFAGRAFALLDCGGKAHS